MVIKSIIGTICACIALVSFNANAIVVNTLNGIDYEWLELTATAGLSRDAVELRLADSNDVLYGYEYASRALVKDLFLLYAPWDGIDGWHGAPEVLSGNVNFINDFGFTEFIPGDGINNQEPTVDGYLANYDARHRALGHYGLEGECIAMGWTCTSGFLLYYDASGAPSMALQEASNGYDTSVSPDGGLTIFGSDKWGSFLVKKISSVPSPVVIDIIPDSDTNSINIG